MSGQCDKESLGTRDISTQRGADVGTHGRGSLHALRVHTAQGKRRALRESFESVHAAQACFRHLQRDSPTSRAS